MASYKRNADLNRDALFGQSSSGGGGGSRGSRIDGIPNSSTQNKTSNNNDNLPVPSSVAAGSSSSSTFGVNKTPAAATGVRRTKNITTSVTGAAKVAKMKEAEGYRKKAKDAMTKKLFSSPDPIAGAMFYHRAAETYKICDENRLERLHRIASGDCQLGNGAFSTAAQEYIRAAELSETSDEIQGRKRAECTKLYKDAADAWMEAGEVGRSGECMLKSAYSMLIGNGEENDEDDDNEIVIDGRRLMSMNKEALKAIEIAVEIHVPDPLNRYKHFRQTGSSAFVNPQENNDETDEEALIELCKSHMITSSFTNETLFQAVQRFLEYGEYKSALYAAGAVTALLECDGIATISLSRAYCVETILALAIGDVVTAHNMFLQIHLQNNSYLSSRECKLAEDLVRAVQMRDVDDLEEARNPGGSNKGALANMDGCVRSLVAGLRISGAVKKASSTPKVSIPCDPIPSSADDELTRNKNVHDELDDLMNDMGLDDDEDEDDDFDLR
jgi:hypothetical protein